MGVTACRGLARPNRRATPHMAAWRAACAELGVHGRDLQSFDISAYRKI